MNDQRYCNDEKQPPECTLGEEISLTVKTITKNFLDFTKVRSKIVPRLINRDRNTALLAHVPHIDKLDLTVVFQYMVSVDDNEQATILIRNEHAERWGVPAEELYRISLENGPGLLPVRFGNISRFLGNYPLPDGSQPPLFVLTNRIKIFGASVILYPGILEQLGNMFNQNLIILPSSVHELLITPIPPEECSEDNILSYSAMVREVNRGVVSFDEFLSDHAYLYTLADHQTRILSE